MYNKIVIVGNLGRDADMRYLPNGAGVASMNVAVNRRWTDKETGETKEATTWFSVSVWGKQADAVHQYCKKGQQVLVEGEVLAPRVYQKRDGGYGCNLEVRATTVRFLGGKSAQEMPEGFRGPVDFSGSVDEAEEVDF